MADANTPDRAKQRSSGSARRPGASDKKGPCREEQQGVNCSGNEPVERGPTPKAKGSSGKGRDGVRDQRAGSTEQSPGS